MSSVAKAVICVFCGSNPGQSPRHMAAAKSLAEEFHKNNISLVYGGGTTGLMGEIARTLVALSGPKAVHGIIPSPLVKYEQKTNLDNLPDEKVYGQTTVVPDMHTRKHLMAKEVMNGGPGGGFVALTGGYGTLEELMEIVTWNQLGIHDQGICVFNVDGYYDQILAWVKGAVAEGMVQRSNSEIISEATDAASVVRALREYKVSKGRFDLDWTNK